MDEMPEKETFYVDIVLKPKEHGLKLRAAESQLLQSYLGEILQEVAEEEKRILEEERLAALEVTRRNVKKGRDGSCI